MKRRMQAAILVAALVAGPASAEPPTGSRLGERTHEGIRYTEEQADEAATRLASCMASKRGSAAQSYVSASTPKELDGARRTLFKEIQCLSHANLTEMSDTTVFSIETDMLRGKLAEALLKSERSTIDALPILPLGKDYSRTWFAATGRNAVIDEMAVCVADIDPRGIAGLIATRAFSKDEGTAFGAVVPALGTCLRVGAKLQANRPALRAALADALYQRMHPVVSAPASSAGTK